MAQNMFLFDEVWWKEKVFPLLFFIQERQYQNPKSKQPGLLITVPVQLKKLGLLLSDVTSRQKAFFVPDLFTVGS